MKKPNKTKAPVVGATQGSQEKSLPQKQHHKFSAKSTATAAQRQRILDALRTGPKTSYDLRRMGCYQCPTRVFELRRQGYSITTQRVTLYDRDGFAHRGAARYHLDAEPADGGAA